MGDERLAARWVAWAGHVAFIHLNDMALSQALLDDAIERGEQHNDPTAQSLALAWLTWTLWTAGDTERAVTLWPRLEALLPQVPDPHDRRYAHIKGLGGTSTSVAFRGDTRTARTQAQQLLDIGNQTGNRPATAMGHMTLVVVNMMLGNQQETLEEADAATGCDADPIYALATGLWSAGMNSLWGDATSAQQTIDELRPLTVRFGLVTSNEFLNTFQAMLDIAAGQLSHGMHELTAIRERSDRAGNDWNCLQVDLFVALLSARIATGEVSGTLASALRNPGFVLRHVRGAAKRARVTLEQLSATIAERGFGAQRPLLELELAKLAIHDKRIEDARASLRRIGELLSHEPDGTIARDAAALLAAL